MKPSHMFAAAAVPAVLASVAIATLTAGPADSADAHRARPVPAVPPVTAAGARDLAASAASDAFLGSLDALACRPLGHDRLRYRCRAREGEFVSYSIRLARRGPAASPVDTYVVDMTNGAERPPRRERKAGRVVVERRAVAVGTAVRLGDGRDELEMTVGRMADSARQGDALDRAVAGARVITVPVRVRNTGRTRIGGESLRLARLHTTSGASIPADAASPCPQEIALAPGESRTLCATFEVDPETVPGLVEIPFRDETGVWRR